VGPLEKEKAPQVGQNGPLKGKELILLLGLGKVAANSGTEHWKLCWVVFDFLVNAIVWLEGFGDGFSNSGGACIFVDFCLGRCAS
jgi:hypothetical protein